MWIPYLKIATGVGAPGSKIRFGAVFGSPRADYLVVESSSAVQASLNGGSNSAASNGWVWTPQGTIATGLGVAGSQIQFADIDGNGKADHLSVGSDGAVNAWFNAGFAA